MRKHKRAHYLLAVSIVVIIMITEAEYTFRLLSVVHIRCKILVDRKNDSLRCEGQRQSTNIDLAAKRNRASKTASSGDLSGSFIKCVHFGS